MMHIPQKMMYIFATFWHTVHLVPLNVLPIFWENHLQHDMRRNATFPRKKYAGHRNIAGTNVPPRPTSTRGTDHIYIYTRLGKRQETTSFERGEMQHMSYSKL